MKDERREIRVTAEEVFTWLAGELEVNDVTGLKGVEDEVAKTEVEFGSEDIESDRISVCVSKVEVVDVRVEFIDGGIEINGNDELATKGVTELLSDAEDEVLVELEDRDALDWDDVLVEESEVDRE